MFKVTLKLALVCSFISFMTACSSTQDAPVDSRKAVDNTPQISNEPVELLIYSNLSLEPDYFEEIFAGPVKAKYPNITLKYIANGKPSISDLVVSGTIPDIMIGSILNLFEFKDLDLLYDMTPLIQKFRFDMSRIDPSLVEQMKQYGTKGEIYGIPYKSNFNALFYNKDLFDKFGTPYPKDGMLWDEVVDLARKVTRTADGVDYLGLDPEDINRLAWAIGGGYVDPKTNKPLIQKWKPAYDLLNRIITIPGNVPATVKKNGDKDAFVKDMKVAMIATTNLVDRLAESKVNWDMVTYPQYPDHKGTYGVAGAQPLMISSKSKYKDQAFQVIQTVMSDEIQVNLNRLGRVTSLSSIDVKKTYGTGIPSLKGKNLAASYALKPAWNILSDYDDDANKITFNRSLDLYKGKDINTVIRETEEEITKAIEQSDRKKNRPEGDIVR